MEYLFYAATAAPILAAMLINPANILLDAGLIALALLLIACGLLVKKDENEKTASEGNHHEAR